MLTFKAKKKEIPKTYKIEYRRICPASYIVKTISVHFVWSPYSCSGYI